MPESVVLGLGLVGGGAVSPAVLAAVVISDVPEGLSSSAGMTAGGRSARYVLGVWGAMALTSGVSALVGHLALQSASPRVVAVITTVAAGAVLAMVVDTTVPEGVERTHLSTGLVTALGFLTGFAVHRVGG